MWRYELIQKYINEYGYRKYLEIGLGYNCDNFCKIHIDTKIGVDPFRPIAIERIVGKSVFYYEMDSNTFLSEYSDRIKDVDIAFIDGLHEYHQVYYECEELMKHIKIGGIILIHDCNPITEDMAISLSDLPEYDRFREPWMGDVWKAIVMLRKVYPEWGIYVENTDCGIGIIKKQGEYIKRKIPWGVETEIANLCYADLQRNRVELLGLSKVDIL